VSRPTVAVVDTSGGPGGAMTSAAALCSLVRARGGDAVVIARCPDAYAALAPDDDVIALGRDSPRAVRGAAYFAREAGRAVRLRGLLRALDADVVIANNSPPLNLAAYPASRALGIPLIQYARGPFLPSPWMSPWVSGASARFAVGSGAAASFAALGVSCEPVVEGLRRDAWPRERSGEGWLWSSALLRWKGLPLALRAYRYASARAPVPRFEVCYAPVSVASEDAAPVPVAPPGARLHELPDDLDALRASCLVYVHSSLIAEPFGRSILEAMAAGLCAVVPAHEASSLVVDGVSGMTYRPNDAADLGEKLLWCARHPRAAARMGATARRRAERFDAARAFAPVVSAIDESLSAARAA
jgi:hypothetical protein